MKFIEFDKHKCDECYKCLRTCPTKAIAFIDNKREIIDDLCIKCGLCQASCPQGALTIQNDIYKIKQAIKENKYVAVSLAPSFISTFEFKEPEQIVTGLKLLGFNWIEETAVGAEVVSTHYEHVIESGTKTNIITSSCPSANYLIEQYYPGQVDSIIPVVSPMIAHGKMIKKKFGDECYVVFIGPCLAKKAEAEEISGAIDAVLTFDELSEWFDEMNIDLSTLEPSCFGDASTKRGCAFPIGSSLWKNDLKTRINNSYKYIRVDGIDRCKDILESMKRGSLENYCIEMNICRGSCINGPGLIKNELTYYERENKIHKYIDTKEKSVDNEIKRTDDNEIEVSRTFKSKQLQLKKPTHHEIKEILASMGRYSVHDELNCGACGYSTCIEKAEAVFNGNSDSRMCLPHLRAKAENLQSAIIEHTPNLICILDEKLRIRELNPAFNRVFNEDSLDLKNLPICTLMEDKLFEKVLSEKQNIIGYKKNFKELDKVFYISIIYLDYEKVVVAIFTDVTLEEKNRQELLRVKEQTITSCQEVIEKQMCVAQEIASLLGETTAETKVNLNRLKDIVLNDDGGL